MAGRPQRFSEDALLAFIRGEAPPDQAAEIAAAREADPQFAAELGVMAALGPALRDGDTVQPPGELAWRRLEAQIRRETPAAAPVPARARQLRMWQAASAICAVAALGQAAFLATRPAAPGYQTASGPAAAAHVLAVAFDPAATEAQMRALIRAAGAEITGGPGAAALYRLGFADEAAREAARAMLDADPIVALVAEE
ncbi:hypothetical protein [Mangrovicoccus algicola]|uniref:Anti-sigma factor n=1 Tax=Mangrovicoccus algicola TaxID=2771008 RepID=A0A8J6ZFS0_9RHOB|nr:hypothetical protein [Mangrovicoccus algicola]MBE3640460.1 hypothetical protein [Mangrovicoccus algicola]